MAAIFKVKSAQRVNLSDRVLAQRFIPILAVAVVYLVAWMAVERPPAVWRRTSSDLKFLDCDAGWWGHGAVIGRDTHPYHALEHKIHCLQMDITFSNQLRKGYNV